MTNHIFMKHMKTRAQFSVVFGRFQHNVYSLWVVLAYSKTFHGEWVLANHVSSVTPSRVAESGHVRFPCFYSFLRWLYLKSQLISRTILSPSMSDFNNFYWRSFLSLMNMISIGSSQHFQWCAMLDNACQLLFCDLQGPSSISWCFMLSNTIHAQWLINVFCMIFTLCFVC